MKPLKTLLSLPAFICLLLNGSGLYADSIVLEPSKDNTLFSEADDSNGQGSYLFVGQNNRGENRRTLLAFDLSSLPQDALIEEATLSLNMNKTITGDNLVGVHRLTRDWGEGASDAEAQEGQGAEAEEGDATWNHTFFPSDTWETVGGDFVESPSATQIVSGTIRFSWEGDGLVADLQNWFDNPETNFGWILVGDETTTSSKRFDSRHATNAASRPTLTITYIVRETMNDWAGYVVESDSVSVNTESFLGWIDIDKAPWIFVYSLNTFVYMPEANVSNAGSWGYIAKP